MLPSEKEALVNLLNAHTNKIVSLIGSQPGMQYWVRESVNRQVEIAEREFLAEPEEVVAT